MFTEITSGTDLQRIALINELVDAWNERIQETVFGWDSGTETITEEPNLYTVPRIAVGESVHKTGLPGTQLRQIQYQLMNNAFFPTDANIIGGWDSEGQIPNWRIKWVLPWDVSVEDAKAGNYFYTSLFTAFCDEIPEMPDGGFRRAKTWYPPPVGTDNWMDLDDPMWGRPENSSRGYFSVGDIYGPWLFYDIQTLFDNMRTVLLHQLTATQYTEWRQGSGATEAGALSAFNAGDADKSASFHQKVSRRNEAGTSFFIRASRSLRGLYKRALNYDRVVRGLENHIKGATASDVVEYYALFSKETSPFSDVYDTHGDHEYAEDEVQMYGQATLLTETDFIGNLSPPAYRTPGLQYGYNMTPANPQVLIRFGSLNGVRQEPE